jgi:Putative auto-transporter adhesin, head GIN domain
MRAHRILTVSAIAAAAALGLSGCVVPTGPIVSEERDIDAVTTVILDAAGDVTIREGEPSLVIHAQQAALGRLTSDVRGDTLTLGARGGFLNWMFGSVSYELTLPDLEQFELNGSGDVETSVSADGTLVILLDGSGDITLDGIDAERVEATISGSGEIELAGTATELVAELDGSGNIDASDLEVRTADARIGGSGDISVHARDTLTVRISGSGNVEYTGDPDIDSNVSGSGDLVKQD